MQSKQQRLGGGGVVRRRWSGAAACGVVLSALAGCAVGPDFRGANPVGMPGAYRLTEIDPHAAISEITTDPAELARWWENFHDPVLTSLIERAAIANRTVQIAETRVRQARASRGITAGGLTPNVNASASASRSRRAVEVGGETVGRHGNSFQAGLDANWEIDIFGGTARAIEAADAGIQAAIEERRNVLITVAGEVALNYADLRGTQDALRVALENLQIQERTLDITRRRLEGGLTTRLDVANAEASVAQTRASIPALRASTQQTIYNLALLLGEQPWVLQDELISPGAIPPVPPVVPAGLPSELLQRRPDIRRAEASLHAATAGIGVATADLYPRFSLTGSLGLASPQLSGLFNLDNRGWSIAPGVRWALFDGGRIRANIELSEARAEEALLAYEQAVLVALRDVQVALESYAREQERRAALTEAVEASRQALDMATRQYNEGLTEFLNVLTAQRSLLQAEDALSRSTQAVTTNLIALYKALGGGWESFEPVAVQAEPSRPGAG